jgi:hypothetical protein
VNLSTSRVKIDVTLGVPPHGICEPGPILKP